MFLRTNNTPGRIILFILLDIVYAKESHKTIGSAESGAPPQGNPGGVAQDAVEIAGLFLGGDRPISYTVSNGGALLERLDPATKPITTTQRKGVLPQKKKYGRTARIFQMCVLQLIQLLG